MIIWAANLRKKASLQRGVTEKDTIACFLEAAQRFISLCFASFTRGLHGNGNACMAGWIATKGNGNMNQ